MLESENLPHHQPGARRIVVLVRTNLHILKPSLDKQLLQPFAGGEDAAKLLESAAYVVETELGRPVFGDRVVIGKGHGAEFADLEPRTWFEMAAK